MIILRDNNVVDNYRYLQSVRRDDLLAGTQDIRRRSTIMLQLETFNAKNRKALDTYLLNDN